MNQREMCKVLTYDVLVPLHQLLATEEISQHYNLSKADAGVS